MSEIYQLRMRGKGELLCFANFHTLVQSCLSSCTATLLQQSKQTDE